ncbi:tRNA threonylcarbamoyladenosine biosynthesis protein TsaB [bacterium A37T11]|nr:tRNA threonylcarbamoyladenosine biosynthesis protein TsaB [bacterium A37T11]
MILQIETSTQICSVSLSDKGEPIALRQLEGSNVHASRLTVLISELMAEGGFSFHQLDAVAVSMGPGSYTGLRIGVSTSKGLCYALDLPLVAVPTLESMAAGFKIGYTGQIDAKTLLLPMIDARRMEVYMAVFNDQLESVQETTATIVDDNTFKAMAETNKLLLFGDGADKFEQLFRAAVNMQVFPDFKTSASHMNELAYKRFQARQFENLAYFEPYYLKDFVPTTPKR